jgi:kynurenine formamidase
MVTTKCRWTPSTQHDLCTLCGWVYADVHAHRLMRAQELYIARTLCDVELVCARQRTTVLIEQATDADRAKTSPTMLYSSAYIGS